MLTILGATSTPETQRLPSPSQLSPPSPPLSPPPYSSSPSLSPPPYSSSPPLSPVRFTQSPPQSSQQSPQPAHRGKKRDRSLSFQHEKGQTSPAQGGIMTLNELCNTAGKNDRITNVTFQYLSINEMLVFSGFDKNNSKKI